MDQDYYNVLGVEKAAEQDAIKKAYRKMAMKYHPDRNPGDKEAEEKFKLAAEAYDVLSNPDKRQRYDQFGKAGVNAGGGFGGGQGFTDMDDIFSAFGDIFGDFFGGGTSRGRQRSHGPRRGADLRYVLQVELEDVLKGAEKEIDFKTDQSCQSCEGSGSKKGSSPETCQTCGGQGQVVRQQGFFRMATACHTCDGRGQVIKDPCGPCRGTGREKVTRKLEVTVPAGVETGNQLRLSSEGEGGYRGGAAGDLYIELQVKDHKKFERQGQNLISEVEVSYTQALLGADVEVETLETPENLEVPSGTESGSVLKVKGQGLPTLRGGKRGDLLCLLKVQMPKKLKKNEEKLLREIAELRGETVKKTSRGLF